MIVNKLKIRQENEATVLKTIIDHKHVSRAEISTITKINKASVSQITKKLIETSFVKEVGIGESTATGGRKPIQLNFNKSSGLAISFDIGYNYLTSMLSYINGESILTLSKKNLSINKNNVLATIDSMMDEFISIAPQTPHGIVGIALAIHGIVNDQKIIFTPYYDLEGIDLITPIENKYNAPVFIENEASLTAIGEYCFASKFESLVSISIHSGIGAGIGLSGQLKTGTHGFVGEMGHAILFPHGKECPCGNKGCLEQYASNKVLFDSFAKSQNLPYVNSDIFSSFYHDGNPMALEMAKENADYLSIGINNIIAIEDPEVVIINSSVYRKIPELIDHIKDKFDSRFTSSVQVENSKLAEQAPLCGGIAIIAKNFLNIKDLKFPSIIEDIHFN